MICFIEIYDETKEKVPILKPFAGPFLLSQSSSFNLALNGL
jgi:hypothetical protein